MRKIHTEGGRARVGGLSGVVGRGSAVQRLQAGKRLVLLQNSKETATDTERVRST